MQCDYVSTYTHYLDCEREQYGSHWLSIHTDLILFSHVFSPDNKMSGYFFMKSQLEHIFIDQRSSSTVAKDRKENRKEK
jgi:hypothetical protein